MNIRQSQIVEMLSSRRAVTVSDIAKRFEVSLMTVRRDLAYLEETGLAVRTRGGAVTPGRIPSVRPMSPNMVVSNEKKAIGKMGAELVMPNQTVMVDSGSTAMQVALNLPEDSGITLVTTSLVVGQTLFGSGIKVIMLGGQLSSRIPSVYGPLTEQEISGIRVDRLFVGCDGAHSTEGFYMSDINAGSLEKAMVKIADTVVLVLESSKFGKTSFVRFMTPEQVDYVITDPGISERDKSALEESGAKVLIADPTAV